MDNTFTWPDELRGKKSFILKTTSQHLAEFTKWLKWEGHFETIEESIFATQPERVRRLKELNNNKRICLSIFNISKNKLVSLIELIPIKDEIYLTNWIIGIRDGLGLGYEAARLMMDEIFAHEEINCIYIDMATYRIESIGLIEKLGFNKVGYHFKANYKNDFLKVYGFHLPRETWIKSSPHHN